MVINPACQAVVILIFTTPLSYGRWCNYRSLNPGIDNDFSERRNDLCQFLFEPDAVLMVIGMVLHDNLPCCILIQLDQGGVLRHQIAVRNQPVSCLPGFLVYLAQGLRHKILF
ncbi:MAG: hypothetical protein AB8G77_18780 [Rhodothermales bacterium]